MGIEAEIGAGLAIISRKGEESFDVALARDWHIAHENFHRRVVELDLAGKGGSIARAALAVEANRKGRGFFSSCEQGAWNQSRQKNQ